MSGSIGHTQLLKFLHRVHVPASEPLVFRPLCLRPSRPTPAADLPVRCTSFQALQEPEPSRCAPQRLPGSLPALSRSLLHPLSSSTVGDLNLNPGAGVTT